MKLLQGLSRRFWYMMPRGCRPAALRRLHARQARDRERRPHCRRASDKLMDYVESFTRATVSV
jgi:hypothetical protein